MDQRQSEAAFETVIEAHLLQNGYVPVAREGFDHERAITLLKECRAVLIAAGVTDELDIADNNPHV